MIYEDGSSVGSKREEDYIDEFNTFTPCCAQNDYIQTPLSSLHMMESCGDFSKIPSSITGALNFITGKRPAGVGHGENMAEDVLFSQGCMAGLSAHMPHHLHVPVICATSEKELASPSPLVLPGMEADSLMTNDNSLEISIKNTFIEVKTNCTLSNHHYAHSCMARLSMPASHFHLKPLSHDPLVPEVATQGDIMMRMNVPAMGAEATHIEAMQSVGSQQHGIFSNGQAACRPCAWFHKTSGCQFGATCLFCHLCPPDEGRNRKKQKHALFRTRRKV